ncbi:hypothetical protein FXV77_20755 [Sphingobacterium phlebotomi]|uniref:Uncharacterized protein n=1 Tax=Sphingobacterium phlebotomi TaxID=2605433 RepID=A0A5D4GSE3_9SPHI|nr:hypothetical protein [Sphingobacterium phlebotomi]TYR31676.1 hypothetical protein FXV77_20755 [Sphingobacterium phlebotomi]
MSNNTYLKQKISEIVQTFTAECDKQHQAITQKKEKERKKEEEKAKRKEDVIKKFDDTILKDLQHLFTEIKPAFSSPYLEILLDTHNQRKRFYIYDQEASPAFAFLALDAKSREDEDTFDDTRYLLFAISVTSGSFDLFVKNESRDFLSQCEDGDEDSTLLQTYPFDDYDFNEIRGHIEKYLTDELLYLRKNFKVRIEEWED